MQPRLLVPVWVFMGMALTAWEEVEGVPLRPQCHMTVLNVTGFCRVVVHHTGTLPRRFSTDEEKEQLKRQICPCPDFEVKGYCPSFIYSLARKYSPAIMCISYRDPVLRGVL